MANGLMCASSIILKSIVVLGRKYLVKEHHQKCQAEQNNSLLKVVPVIRYVLNVFGSQSRNHNPKANHQKDRQKQQKPFFEVHLDQSFDEGPPLCLAS